MEEDGGQGAREGSSAQTKAELNELALRRADDQCANPDSSLTACQAQCLVESAGLVEQLLGPYA